MKFLFFNFKFLQKRGFTLVELLVVLTIFLTVGGVIITVLFISFRGSSKSEVVTSVKQSGTFALSQIVKSIRYAGSLDTPDSCIPSTSSSTLTVTSITDGLQTTYSCPADMNSPITSNSAALVDTSKVVVSQCSFTCSQTSLVDPPKVTIQFTLTSKSGGGALVDTSTIPFQSSVIMRNAAQ